ncbi:MAG: ABC transporter permease [Clostridia bacterium]|nr:ABC transporter permease [Clostridia bacterium]
MEQYFARYFSEKKMADAWVIIQEDFLSATVSTLYITLMSTLLAILIGLPLGVLLVTGDQKGIRPLPRWLMGMLNWIINILRSAPFIILIVLLMPFTRLLLGSAVGDAGVIVPLVIAAFPFVARLVEGSLRELNPNIIEMAQSSGANTWQIVFHVMLPESVPSLITAFTTAITTILGYTAMSGAVGGGGLGNLAISQGQQRSNHAVMLAALVILIVLVQILQTFGTWLARKADKRLKNK